MEHLEGITILNEYMTYETPWFAYLFLALMGIFLMLSIIFADCFSANHPCIICVCCTVVFGILMVIALCGVWNIEAGMVYECIIDDGVTYKELTSVYKIVEQHGDIYKLKFLD